MKALPRSIALCLSLCVGFMATPHQGWAGKKASRLIERNVTAKELYDKLYRAIESFSRFSPPRELPSMRYFFLKLLVYVSQQEATFVLYPGYEELKKNKPKEATDPVPLDKFSATAELLSQKLLEEYFQKKFSDIAKDISFDHTTWGKIWQIFEDWSSKAVEEKDPLFFRDLSVLCRAYWQCLDANFRQLCIKKNLVLSKENS